MGYTPQTINPGDVASASWANKVENFLAQFGNYQGVLSSKDNLPASADVGDWYLVLDAMAIFVWDGSKWVKVGGGGVNYVLDDTVLELVDTSIAVKNEVPSGTVDGVNTSFTLLNVPIWPGTLVITVDGTTTITDNGDGTLSDGGTVDYATGTFNLASAPTTSIMCSYNYQYWDGIKYVDIGLDPDYPQKITVLFDARCDSGTIQIRVRLYDSEDDSVLGEQSFDILPDGMIRTYMAEFDVSTLSRPGFVYAQIEVNASPGASGEQSIVEVTWS